MNRRRWNDQFREPRTTSAQLCYGAGVTLRRFAIVLVVAATAARLAATAPLDSAELRSKIKARVDGGKNTGIVAAVITADGRVTIDAYGDAGPDARPLDADSVFEIGSITKVFTATILMEMVERGDVALEDPVGTFLPASVRVPERNGRKITLLDLVTQSSGLPRLPDNLKPSDPANPYADYTVEQMYDFLGRCQLTRDPGQQYEYSNLGMGLLGHALARHAGTTYEALVRNRILVPLRMEHTGIDLSGWMREHLVKGHDGQGHVVANWDIPTLAGAGALRSTLNDMILFARANLDPSGGRLQKTMQRTHEIRMPAGRDDMSIGMAWHVRRVGSQAITWHNGGTGGYRTWLGFDKARRTAAIILSNSQQGADDLGFELLVY
jgi:D-alanyl-D-alanine-carboxypeptidase/D-alanyl-D-alanine-endopeptidase